MYVITLHSVTVLYIHAYTYCILYTVYCILSTSLILYIVYCILYTVYCILNEEADQLITFTLLSLKNGTSCYSCWDIPSIVSDRVFHVHVWGGMWCKFRYDSSSRAVPSKSVLFSRPFFFSMLQRDGYGGLFFNAAGNC